MAIQRPSSLETDAQDLNEDNVNRLALRWIIHHDTAETVTRRAFAAVGNGCVGVQNAVRRCPVFGLEGEAKANRLGVISLQSTEGARGISSSVSVKSPPTGGSTAYCRYVRRWGGLCVSVTGLNAASRPGLAPRSNFWTSAGGFLGCLCSYLGKTGVFFIDAQPDRRAGQERVLAGIDEKDVRIGKAGAVLNTVFLEGEDAAIRRKSRSAETRQNRRRRPPRQKCRSKQPSRDAA